MEESTDVVQALGAAFAFFTKAAENGYDPINDTADALRDEALMEKIADSLTGSGKIVGEFTSAGVRDWISFGIEAMNEFRSA